MARSKRKKHHRRTKTKTLSNKRKPDFLHDLSPLIHTDYHLYDPYKRKRREKLKTDRARRQKRLHFSQTDPTRFKTRFYNAKSVVQPNTNRNRNITTVDRYSPYAIKGYYDDQEMFHLERQECEKRRIKREVLFAKNRHGAGNAKPKFDLLSKVRC